MDLAMISRWISEVPSKMEEFFEAGDRVVQRWRYHFEGGHVRGVDLFWVRDGKVAEKLSYVKG